MDLSIIIVNWNSGDYVRACLKSIFDTVFHLSFEVIVIDNGSGDGCGAMLAREFPSVIFIENNENLGFAKANNAAFAHAEGDAILFLNPDTLVLKGSVMRLWRGLQELPRAGIVGARLLNSDGTLQTSCIQAFPTILNQLLDSEFLRRRFPRAQCWGMAALFNGVTHPEVVDMVSGACLMVKREVFERIGWFSTYCFMYVEDVDLCFKARRAGWQTYYVPDAAVTHHGGGSAARSTKTFSAVMTQESMRRFFTRTRGRWYARVFTVMMAFMALQRCILLGIALVLCSTAGYGQDAWPCLNKWLAILRWTVGRESWIKRYD
jgi:N-acetylglucosaminyl-diphospho-decaprenol L-rhamnosyltransferase